LWRSGTTPGNPSVQAGASFCSVRVVARRWWGVAAGAGPEGGAPDSRSPDPRLELAVPPGAGLTPGQIVARTRPNDILPRGASWTARSRCMARERTARLCTGRERRGRGVKRTPVARDDARTARPRSASTGWRSSASPASTAWRVVLGTGRGASRLTAPRPPRAMSGCSRPDRGLDAHADPRGLPATGPAGHR